MAKITIDMGKEGLQGYRNLQTLVNGDKEETKLSDSPDNQTSEDDDEFSLDNFANSVASVSSISGIQNKSTNGAFYSPDDWGSSMFDENGLGEVAYQKRFDIRAENQPWYAKIGAGVVKMGVLAVTTFLDGIGGTVAGILNTLVEGASGELHSVKDTKKAFVMNPLSKALQALNEKAESWMPNYYTEEEIKNEESGQWYRNIASANFIGDKFLKNIGFTIGAAASAIISSGAASKVFISSELRNAFKGTVYKAAKEGGEKVALKTGKDVYKAMHNGEQLFTKSGKIIEEGSKLMKDLQKSAVKLKNAEWGLKLFGSVNSAMGEGRIEAIGAVKEFQDKQYNNITSWANNIINNIKEELMANHEEWFNEKGEIIDPIGLQVFNERIKPIKEKRDKLLEESANKSADIANYVFIGNVALLSFSNFIQFGRAMSGGFTTANNFKKLLKPVVSKKFIEENGKEAAKKLTKKLGKEGIETGVNKFTLAKQYGRAFMNPFTEGFEEINQAVISRGAALKSGAELNEFSRGLTLDGMYADTIDPEANKYAVGYMNSLLDGLMQTYGKSQSWEEFAIGFVTGALGIPKVGRKANGKRGLQMSGEFVEGLRDAKKMKQEAQELAGAINARINTPEMREYYKGLIRHTKGEKDKLDFLMKDDQFNYKDSEFKQLISDAIMFDKAGRLEDFYEMIEDYSKLTGDEKESLQTIISNSKYDVEEDGKKVLDADGKPVQRSMYEGYSIERMNEEVLKPRAEKARRAVEFYVKNSNALKALYGDNISRDVLEEMVYGLSQLDNWSDRSREMLSEINRAIKKDFSTVNNILGEEDQLPIDDDLIKSYEDVQTYLQEPSNKNAVLQLYRKIKSGTLTEEEENDLLGNLERIKDIKRNTFSRFYKKFTNVEKDIYNKLNGILNTINTDAYVKGSIIDKLETLFKENSDILKFDDYTLKADFEDVIKEAINNIGEEAVAAKLIEWNRYLSNVKKETQGYNTKTHRLEAKNIDKEKLIDRLYEDIRKEHEKAYYEQKTWNDNEVKENIEKRKNKIKENYKKRRNTLSLFSKNIKKQLRNNKALNSIDLDKYVKLNNDLLKIAIARAAMLDKLMELSKHPERFTAEAMQYKKDMQDVVKNAETYSIANAINECKTFDEIQKVLHDNEIDDSETLKAFLSKVGNSIEGDTKNIIDNISKIWEFRDVLSKSVANTIDEFGEHKDIILAVGKKIEDNLVEGETDFDKLYNRLTSNDIYDVLRLKEDTDKKIFDEIRATIMISYDAAKASKEDENGEKESSSEETPKGTETNPESSTPTESSPQPQMSPFGEPIVPEEQQKPVTKSSEKNPDIEALKNKPIEEIKKEEENATNDTDKEIAQIAKEQKEAENKGVFPYNGGEWRDKKGDRHQTAPHNIPGNKKSGDKEIGNSIAEEPDDSDDGIAYFADETAFTNRSVTKYSVIAAKANILKEDTPKKEWANLQQFLDEYNAFDFVDEGFLDEVERNTYGQIPIHFMQIDDPRTSYSHTYKGEEETRHIVITAVKVNDELISKLKKRFGDNLKLVEYSYTDKNGNNVTEYYQIVGTLSFNQKYQDLNDADKKKAGEVFSDLKALEDKSLYNQLKVISSHIAKADSDKLISYLNILYNKKIYGAVVYELEHRSKDRKDSSVLTTYNGESSTTNNSIGFVKSLNFKTAIKNIYNGRLVNSYLEKNAGPKDTPIRKNYDVTNDKGLTLNPNSEGKMLKSPDDSSDIKGKDLHLGIYYGNGVLQVPSLDDSQIVELSTKNDNANASYVPEVDAGGKPVKKTIDSHSGGSIWMMVKLADGKYYPKSICMKRFNSEEYPMQMWANGVDNPIINRLRNSLRAMCDVKNGNKQRALAKFIIKEELLFIPDEYDLVFNDSNVSLIVKNTKETAITIDLTKEGSINDKVEEFLKELNTNSKYNFRFQLASYKLNADVSGNYRQSLIDSNVMFTNLPVMSNVGASFEMYRFSTGGNVFTKEQKAVKHESPKKEDVSNTTNVKTWQYRKFKYDARINKDNRTDVTVSGTKTVPIDEIVAAIKIMNFLYSDTSDEVEIKEGNDGTYYRIEHNGEEYIFKSTSKKTETVVLNYLKDADWDNDVTPISKEESRVKHNTDSEENLPMSTDLYGLKGAKRLSVDYDADEENNDKNETEDNDESEDNFSIYPSQEEPESSETPVDDGTIPETPSPEETPVDETPVTSTETGGNNENNVVVTANGKKKKKKTDIEDAIINIEDPKYWNELKETMNRALSRNDLDSYSDYLSGLKSFYNKDILENFPKAQEDNPKLPAVIKKSEFDNLISTINCYQSPF